MTGEGAARCYTAATPPHGETGAAVPHPKAIVRSNAFRTPANWPEYLMEAALLGLFMVSACAFTALLEHPSSPAQAVLPGAFARRALMGVAMGATAIAIVYSPWGKRSGAHINPATTLTFLRLGKVQAVDAFFYAVAQFGGALAGCLVAGAALSGFVRHPSVRFAVTQPGSGGLARAFAAETLIAFLLMSVVLAVSNDPRTNRFTGLAAGACVALFITFEAPISGMSMNPARTFGSAAAAMRWEHLWIYFVAPPLGMLLAAELRLRLSGARSVLCAKLHHENDHPCIFRCGYRACGPAPAGVAIARGGA
jgi:aquaporin Z